MTAEKGQHLYMLIYVSIFKLKTKHMRLRKCKCMRVWGRVANVIGHIQPKKQAKVEQQHMQQIFKFQKTIIDINPTSHSLLLIFLSI